MKWHTTILASFLILASCANVRTAYVAATTSTVPAHTIDVGINAWNLVKTAATGYVAYCTPNPTPAGCNDAVIQGKLVPAINKGTTASRTLRQFLRDHPGALGDRGVYDAMVTATSTLQQLLANNDTRAKL